MTVEAMWAIVAAAIIPVSALIGLLGGLDGD